MRQVKNPQWSTSILVVRQFEDVPTENRSAPRLTFSLEESEQIVPNKDVQIDCDLDSRRGGEEGDGVNDHTCNVRGSLDALHRARGRPTEP